MQSIQPSVRGACPRVLVTWGTKLGGTEGIARIIGETLEGEGLNVDIQSASMVRNVDMYDAAIIGGALYANRWHADACSLVNRNVASLRRIPVWMFSSGPLDDSADDKDIPPPTQISILAERIGAQGHKTFGGRLPPDAKGFPASAMAKTKSGDWRNPERIRAWAREVARAIPVARPGVAVDHSARSLGRLMAHAVFGGALCAGIMGGLLQASTVGVAIVFHAVVAVLAFVVIAVNYFKARGAREPLPTALTFAAVLLLMNGAVTWLVQRNFGMLMSFGGTWLPLALIFLSTWMVGFLMSTMPWPEAPAKTEQARPADPLGGTTQRLHR